MSFAENVDNIKKYFIYGKKNLNNQNLMYQIIYLNKISKIYLSLLNYFFYLLIILFITSGCINKEKQEGVVATVNGEIITLRSIESLLNSKFTPILMFKNSSLNTTKKLLW